MSSHSWSLVLHVRSALSTENGIRQLDQVRRGDVLITRDGDPVRVINIQRLSGRPGNRSVPVVMIAPGAFDPHIPSTAVTLTAETIVAATDRAKAGRLANGATVTSDTADAADIYRLDLSGPGTVDLNGLGVQFTSATSVGAQLDPAELASVRRHLRERALATGWRSLEDHRIQIAVDGAIIVPESFNADHARFVLEKPAQTFQIFSSAAVAYEQIPASEDGRRLGVQVVWVRADGQDLSLQASSFGHGFHEMEHTKKYDFRWTDGNATLRLPFAVSLLEIGIGSALPVLEFAPARHSAASPETSRKRLGWRAQVRTLVQTAWSTILGSNMQPTR